MSYNSQNPNGQATMANSEPVVIASNQSAIPVTDNAGSLTVDGSVSITGTPTVALDSASLTALENITVQNAAGASAVNIQDGGNSITVDGTVAATKSGTWVLDANSGVDIGDVTINNASGAAAVNIQDGGNSITVDGSVTVSGTVTASNTAGDVAHGTADSGNPVKIGFKVETALPTAEVDNDRANGISDRYGRQLTSHIDPGMSIWRYGEYTTAQTGTNIWTPTSGNRFVITSIHIGTGSTTAALVTLWGAATGTTAWASTDQTFFRGTLTPTATGTPGVIIQPSFPLYSDTTNDCLKITTSAGITIYVTVYGYEITP